MIIGLISYDSVHLKTEQITLNLIRNPQIQYINIYALDFVPRKERDTVFSHRPNQSQSVPTRSLGEIPNVSWRRWDGRQITNNGEEYFLIAGAGIIDAELAGGVRIINCHPGIIPIQRGLDAFKWAIHDDKDLGNTLHYIDNEVDSGEVIATLKTEVFSSDRLETLARRHYENEIFMLSNFLHFVEHGGWRCAEPAGAPRKRMPAATEAVMIDSFQAWKAKRVGATGR